MTRVFVIRPFGTKTDASGKALDFERVQKELLDPVLAALDLQGATTGEIIDAGNIRDDMFSLILEADLAICDITIHNANVFYELGIRHALRKRHTILIKGIGVADGTPFDLLTDRYLPYEIDHPDLSQEQLTETIRATLNSIRETDSPVFQMMPELPEADPATLADRSLPIDFRDEVERAQEARSKGWLRVLVHDLRERRFQRVGLQLVANVQWQLKDYEGALESFKALLNLQGKNAATSLALANIYERLYRDRGKRELLRASDQAIKQTMASPDATPEHRVEALTLQGRNQKTRWRLTFQDLASVKKRRTAAMNQALRQCYESYRKAFYQDLNKFYAGLAALQVGMIFLNLSEGVDNAWMRTFDSDREAKEYRKRLLKEVRALQLLVPAAVEAGLDQLELLDPERTWAEVSKADLLFLSKADEQRVISRYQHALPKDNLFVGDAAKGQLQLFADLGIQDALARVVIAAIDEIYALPRIAEDKAPPLHVVLFAGHRVDTPGRSEARFPAQHEDRARQLIYDALSKLDRKHQLLGLASAAPGADILFHEVCDDLNIPSILCLPMPAADYARLEFKHCDDWRSRFLRLKEAKKEILELSDQEGLPKWLYGAQTNPWVRGNFWVLQMALTAGAETITLIALWDHKKEGDAPGGTADMVHIVKETGKIHIEIIPAELLLK